MRACRRGRRRAAAGCERGANFARRGGDLGERGVDGGGARRAGGAGGGHLRDELRRVGGPAGKEGHEHEVGGPGAALDARPARGELVDDDAAVHGGGDVGAGAAGAARALRGGVGGLGDREHLGEVEWSGLAERAARPRRR